MQGKVNPTFVLVDELIKEAEVSTSITTISVNYSNARKLPQLIAASAATFAAFVVGTMIGWSSSVQTQLQRNITNADDPNSIWLILLNQDQMSWISSLLNIGALIGSLFGGLLIDWMGRRGTLIAQVPLFIIGWILITLTVHTSMLYVGRIVCGIAAGISTVTGPCYIGEVSTPMMRGVIGMLYAVSISAGIWLSSLLAWLDWRWISGILTILPVFCLPIALFVTESPYFLVNKDRLEEGRKALKWLRGPNFDIETELTHIENRAKEDAKQIAHFSDVLQPWAYKPVLIGMGMMSFQQFSGSTVVLYYSVEILSLAGSDLDPRTGSVIVKAALVIVGAFSSAVLVQRINRRTLFILSEFFSALSIFVMGAYFYMKEQNTASDLRWLPIASLIVFISSSGLGIIPLSWLVSNEVLPAKYRGPGSTIVTFTFWASAFIATKTFENLQEALTLVAPFWFYGCCTVLGVLFGIFLLPETRNKTPEQIQSLFL